MDVYETSTTDYFRIDDLLDLSNDEDYPCSSSSAPGAACHLPPPPSPSTHYFHSSAPCINPSISSDFTDHLSLPSDEVAELEWLSQFVEDSFSDFLPNSSLTGTINVQSQNASFSSRACTKRFEDTEASWEADQQPPPATTGRSRLKKEASPADGGGVRRCTHCASEKTPQWRTGPLGPKTLCNACGVRYKSGRLVPEYRPAASPTFVLTQHSNSHRKVMELRRQKEMLRQQRKQQEEQHIYHHDHHHQDFEVC